MALALGTRFGPYEITSQIGTGGMGEVYRASDTKLGRDVAIKVLPESMAGDIERLARFDREAKILAAVSHPGIAAVYGLEDAGGTSALVMELVEGPTLNERIAQGPIPPDETLAIARQIAEALEAAHELGIVHRDLKPANIKLRSDGTVKVLDFGLAKPTDVTIAPNPSVSMSPTLTSPAVTQAGLILGTAAYMSPEQARGRPVDRRADIWAFGCVLYEMLTGRQAFPGDDVSLTLASVLKEEPDWSALPPTVPSSVVVYLQRCLSKDPRERVQSIGDVRLAIDGAFDDAAGRVAPASTVRQASRQWRSWLAAVVVAGVTAVLTAYLIDGNAPVLPAGPPMRLTATIPDALRLTGALTLSPDGGRMAFVAVGEDGRDRIWVRDLGQPAVRPLPDSEGVFGAGSMFWSPDGSSLGYFTLMGLWRADRGGGPPVLISEEAAGSWGAWSADGRILFTGEDGALWTILATGGAPTQLAEFGDAPQDTVLVPGPFLSDGRRFLFTRVADDAVTLHVGMLDEGELETLGPIQSNVAYALGHIFFLRQDDVLMAQSFDEDELALVDNPVPIASGAQSLGTLRRGNANIGAFAVSPAGVLVYQTAERERTQLEWRDRTGTVIDTLGEPTDQVSVELSHDGTRVAVSVREPGTDIPDLWLYDVIRGLRTRLTFDGGVAPTWSPDDQRLAFTGMLGGLYRVDVSGAGSPESILDGAGFPQIAVDWTSDGMLTFWTRSPESDDDIFALPAEGNADPVPVLQSSFAETNGRISPDGRWIAYQSNVSGQDDIFVSPLPGPGGRWQVSVAGGRYPRWREDGRELFFVSPDNVLMAAAVDGAEEAFEIGAIDTLFQVDLRQTTLENLNEVYNYDVTGDGQRFLVNTSVEAVTSDITVIVDWPGLVRGAQGRPGRGRNGGPAFFAGSRVPFE